MHMVNVANLHALLVLQLERFSDPTEYGPGALTACLVGSKGSSPQLDGDIDISLSVAPTNSNRSGPSRHPSS